MQSKRNVKNNPLRQWYYDLPVRKMADSRDDIVKYCGITLSIFYRWLSGQTPIPYTAQVIINQVTGQRVFEVETPVMSDKTEVPCQK